jgi:hypothetical protein
MYITDWTWLLRCVDLYITNWTWLLRCVDLYITNWTWLLRCVVYDNEFLPKENSIFLLVLRMAIKKYWILDSKLNIEYKKKMLTNIPGTLRSAADPLLLRTPRTKLSTAGQRAFTYTGPSTWNSLPKHLREAALFETFKQQLKTFLFN